MTCKKAKKWIKKLNKSGYAGYHDWRLPTVEEAVSLLESSKKNGDLYIDPVFSKYHDYIWTGDRYGSGGDEPYLSSWGVGFRACIVGRGRILVSNSGGVRPVRSVR